MFSRLVCLPGSRKQRPSIVVETPFSRVVLAWKGHRNSATLGLLSHINTSTECPFPPAWGQGCVPNMGKAWKGYQAVRGKGGERKARGNRGTITIVRSSHRVEEDFPDPLTLRLGSERKRKHICTDPLSELPQGGAQASWPFATCRAIRTHRHS